MSSTIQSRIQHLLHGSGVTLNGSEPWDVHVHDERTYTRVLAEQLLGLGEAYMDGWWDCDRIDELFNRLLRAGINDHFRPGPAFMKDAIVARVVNLQDPRRAFRVGEVHYDVGNDLFRLMLDKRLTYTCGYWKEATTLDEAQEAKLDLTCRKIGLRAGQRVLDIGCGWGSFAKFAAERYGARVTGVTISKEQATLARELCADFPVEILLQDYRAVRGQFDHVVSLGMFEHVGPRNYRTYFQTARRVLKDDGLFLLHTIGGRVPSMRTDPWLDRYIFPGSVLPSPSQVTKTCERLFVIEDWHNFGSDYDKTLIAWHDNLEPHWKDLAPRYDERFRRMWRFYLLLCAGLFRARQTQLWQIVLSPHGIPGGYTSVR